MAPTLSVMGKTDDDEHTTYVSVIQYLEFLKKREKNEKQYLEWLYAL